MSDPVLMFNSGVQKLFTAARESLTHAIEFTEFLVKLSPKDRVNAERRVSVLEAEADPRRAPLWRRFVCSLMTLAPVAKFVGKQTVQFYVPDGKYRMQVFALEDVQDGVMTLYCPNILEEVEKAGLLTPSPNDGPHIFAIEPSREPLRVEPLDKSSLNSAAHFKDMVGWNRKAIRITVPPAPSAVQVDTAELLCAIAAQHFVRTPPPADAAPQRYR